VTDNQPSRKHQIQNIAILACGAVGTGTGTGLAVGTPIYMMTIAEDRAFDHRSIHPNTGEGIAIGVLGVALGTYIVHKSAQWLYKHI